MSAPAQITDPYPSVSDQLAADPSAEARLNGGIFEPPSSLVLSAISRNKLIILATAVVCALIGVGIGTTRERTYTASATLQVGQVNPNSPGFYSYVDSATALASAFSRSISAEPVLATVQQKLKLPPSKAVTRLSAEPIPLSPAFRVIATGTTGSEAVQLANVAANAVITYESQSNSSNPEATALLHEYRTASFQLQKVAASLARLRDNKATSAEALAQAQAEKNAAEVRLRATGDAYTAAVTSEAPRSGLVSLLAGATSASSDRSSKVEIFGFIGLLVGIVIGCMIVTLRERRRIDRRLDAGVKTAMQESQPA